MGLNGLWYGFGVGLLTITVFYIKLLTTTDWDERTLQIQTNIEKQVTEFELQRTDTPSTGSSPTEDLEACSDNFHRLAFLQQGSSDLTDEQWSSSSSLDRRARSSSLELL
jgi:hypothetical protein